MQRVFVAGCGGFVGRHLFRYLCGLGLEVSGADLAAAGRDQVALDLADGQALADLLAERQPDLIYHVAGLAGSADPARLRAAHVETTRALLTAVRHACPAARVVILGSAAEYGSAAGAARQPIAAGSPACPPAPYARAKWEQSALAARLAAEWDLDVVRLRLFNTLGPGQSTALVAGALVRRLRLALQGGVDHLLVYDPASVRDFSDVRDVARLLWLLAGRAPRGPEHLPIHVASGRGTSVEELARLLLAAAGVDLPLRLVSGQGAPTWIVADVADLQALVAPQALQTIDLARSLADMWHWEFAPDGARGPEEGSTDGA